MFRLAVDALNLTADRRGMGRYVRQILDQWTHDPGIEVSLLVRDAGHRAPLQAEFGLDVRMLRDAKRTAFDAVWYPWNGIRFELPARRVVTMHDAFAFTEPARGWLARRREQRPIRIAAARADALATVSRWSARELSRTLGLPRERFTITGNVCDSFWQPDDGVGSNDPYIFFLGGPEQRKNAALLFEAFASAFPRRGVRLVVGGTLADADERRLRNATFAFERVKPDDRELRALYSHALAVAVPSYAEGFGLPALEAMACGAPVLAADAGALPETCDGAAMLLPAHDVDAWGAALIATAAQPDLRADLRAKSLARAARIDRTAPARVTLALLRRSL
jgi:glycosyltransferase involved in cell wall biosynthesis